jgi:hypothetical protein
MVRRNYLSACANVVCLGLLAFAIGCGKEGAKRGAIHGEVKLDGQLLEAGAVMFSPIEGTKGPATGGEIKNGRYELSGAAGPVVGWNRVEFRATRKSGRKVPSPFGRPGEMIDEMVGAVAPQYGSASKLKVEVLPGDNTKDFQIQSK